MIKIRNNRIAIVQARMNSTRLPGKVLKKINNIPVILHLLNRVKKAKNIDEIILATTKNSSDDVLYDIVNSSGFKCFRGDEDNVLLRYINCASKNNGDTIIRITGDCPLIDPKIIDKTIELFFKKNVDYCSNINPPTFPDGLDVEVVKLSSLEKTLQLTNKKEDLEHVTKFIRDNEIFKKTNFQNQVNISSYRWTLDEEKDLNFIREVFNYFHPKINFLMEDILKLKTENPKIFNINANIKRNEGLKMQKGQKLWKRAKEIIPSGNSLLSKNSDMFLPNFWPSYFSKSKGCYLWDLDNSKYIDMSIMGIGTNILGYGNNEVDEAVKKVIKDGNMSTLNCPEEVYLAERLLQIHPWAQKIKFSRSGGEANAISIRIARAASRRDNVAFCGYHGWHDWYLAANLPNQKNLDNHLLPGLNAKGVPTNLSGTVFPFNFNDYEELEKIVKTNNIGVIKMEVFRNVPPKKGFLEKVRKLADSNNIVLIFDECTSGFRENFGGLQLKYKIIPDILILGKALGNGYAINAVLGKSEIMDEAENSFISSTFWTERIGPTAALKTLEVMEKEKSWENITLKGTYLRKKWKELAKKYDLEIQFSGLPALSSFTFLSNSHLAYKTFITQEMLKDGILASNLVYLSTSHTNEIIDLYIKKLDKIFAKIRDCEDGKNIISLLDGPICNSGFKRLN